MQKKERRMTPREIKILLLQREINHKQLAKKLNVHMTSVSHVVNHRILHKQGITRRKFAEYFGLPEQILWTEDDILKSKKDSISKVKRKYKVRKKRVSSKKENVAYLTS